MRTTERSESKPSPRTGIFATLRASVSTGRTRLALLAALALTAAPAFDAPAHGILNWRTGDDS